MFTSVARFITWWAAEPNEGDKDPIMTVIRALADVNIEAKDFKTCQMNSHIAVGMLYGIVQQKELNSL